MKTTCGQISYHCPNKFYGMVEKVKIEHPEFDGHTPADVIERLTSLAVGSRNFTPPTNRKERTAEEIQHIPIEIDGFGRTRMNIETARTLRAFVYGEGKE